MEEVKSSILLGLITSSIANMKLVPMDLVPNPKIIDKIRAFIKNIANEPSTVLLLLSNE